MAYNSAIAEYVCEQLALGRSLLSISKDGPDKLGIYTMPSRAELWRWEETEPHKGNSVQARAIGFHQLAEECIEIANMPHIGETTTTNPDGTEFIKREDMLGHRRLQIDTRMRLLGKWLPKIYGDKIEHEHKGSVNITATKHDEAL